MFLSLSPQSFKAAISFFEEYGIRPHWANTFDPKLLVMWGYPRLLDMRLLSALVDHRHEPILLYFQNKDHGTLSCLRFSTGAETPELTPELEAIIETQIEKDVY